MTSWIRNIYRTWYPLFSRVAIVEKSFNFERGVISISSIEISMPNSRIKSLPFSDILSSHTGMIRVDYLNHEVIRVMSHPGEDWDGIPAELELDYSDTEQLTGLPVRFLPNIGEKRQDALLMLIRKHHPRDPLIPLRRR